MQPNQLEIFLPLPIMFINKEGDKIGSPPLGVDFVSF
jgi:hypothetical protein